MDGWDDTLVSCTYTNVVEGSKRDALYGEKVFYKDIPAGVDDF